jgi:hypothetical protein
MFIGIRITMAPQSHARIPALAAFLVTATSMALVLFSTKTIPSSSNHPFNLYDTYRYPATTQRTRT